MNFQGIIEGPLLWITFFLLAGGIIFRFALFAHSMIRFYLQQPNKWIFIINMVGRSLLPIHRIFNKRPAFSIIRYIFHVCLIATPIWFAGHVMLLEDSCFHWGFSSISYKWSDQLSLLVLAFILFFFLRRIFIPDIRKKSNLYDFILLIFAAFPYLTGYFLAHGTLEDIAIGINIKKLSSSSLLPQFFLNSMVTPINFIIHHLWTIHILCGEAMIILAIFLFVKTEIDSKKCTGCVTCTLSCPAHALTYDDVNGQRILTHRHYQCIYCAACMNICPEGAIELRHEISFQRFFQINFRRKIHTVALLACKQCGVRFAPEPGLEKIFNRIGADFLNLCPRCRRMNILNATRPLHLELNPGAAGETLGSNNNAKSVNYNKTG